MFPPLRKAVAGLVLAIIPSPALTRHAEAHRHIVYLGQTTTWILADDFDS